MLFNEFLKAHRKLEEQQATIAEQQSANLEQQKQIDALKTALKEQAAEIQKVSAVLAAVSPSGCGLEATKSSPQIVLNNQ